MADNLEIGAQHVFLRLSTTSVADALGEDGKIVVCEESSGLSSASNVSERKTKCGTITNTDTPTRTVSGSGVAAGNLLANAVSAQQLLLWQEANQLLYFAYLNKVSGDLTQGEVIYMTGNCRVSTVNVTSDIGDGVVTFDYEMAVTGVVDLVV